MTRRQATILLILSLVVGIAIGHFPTKAKAQRHMDAHPCLVPASGDDLAWDRIGYRRA